MSEYELNERSQPNIPDWVYCVFAEVVAAAFAPGIGVMIASLFVAAWRC